MRRGDIFIADLEPIKGQEANKKRPVIIVSNNDSNIIVEESGFGMFTIVPLTHNTDRIYNFQVFLAAEVTGLKQDSKAQAEQIRAISAERLRSPVLGNLPGTHMQELDNAIRLHLAL